MSHARRLNQSSGILFSLAFVISQLRYTPVLVVSAIASLSSLTLYFFAYTLWYLSSRLYPDNPPLKEHWYGFTEFKKQHIAAAVLGTVGVVCSVAAFVFPLAALPAVWLFALSNCIWFISEFHRQQIISSNQHNDNFLTHDLEYSSRKQNIYLKYAAIITVMAIMTAVATTITIFIPSITVAIIATTTVLGLCLSAVAAQKWIEYFVFDYPTETCKKSSSYRKMFDQDAFFTKNPEDPQNQVQENFQVENELLVDSSNLNIKVQSSQNETGQEEIVINNLNNFQSYEEPFSPLCGRT